MATNTDCNELYQCLLPTWYRLFENLTFKTKFVSLPREFIDYLLSDGIILPQGCELPHHGTSSDNEIDWEDNETNSPSFNELVQEIFDSIQIFNGRVFPKLNQCSPKDAVWIAFDNTLKCNMVGEVILLLKSSDIISQMLSKYRKTANGKYTLCLREWKDLIGSGEFRCFIKESHLIAISQRDCTNCYKHLLDNVETITVEITQFCILHVVNKFPLKNFVMDIYRSKQEEILIVDFNPFHCTTNSLLFKWEELEQMIPGDVPEIRLIEGPLMIQPSSLYTSRLPKDAIDLASGNDIHKLVDLLKMQEKQHSNGDSK